MGSTKSKNKPRHLCRFGDCKKTRERYGEKEGISSFCTTHKGNATINAYLSRSYSGMKRRIEGRGGGNREGETKYWKGKPILPRDVFMTWAKNHPDFLSLYKRYVMSDFDIKLAPSVNRMDSNKGYVLGNIEWLTQSQNSALAGTVRKMKNQEKKEIYKLLGVKQNV